MLCHCVGSLPVCFFACEAKSRQVAKPASMELCLGHHCVVPERETWRREDGEMSEFKTCISIQYVCQPPPDLGPPASGVQVRRYEAVHDRASRRAPIDVSAQVPQPIDRNVLAKPFSAAVRWVGATVEPIQDEGSGYAVHANLGRSLRRHCTGVWGASHLRGQQLEEAAGSNCTSYAAAACPILTKTIVHQDDCGLNAQESPEKVAPACLEDSLVAFPLPFCASQFNIRR